MNLLAFFSHELTIERTCSMIIKVCTHLCTVHRLMVIFVVIFISLKQELVVLVRPLSSF